MHGEPALQADFAHLPYVNPDAPKGGRINYAWPGTFDSINPFIVQGSGARGMHRPDLRQQRLRDADAAFAPTSRSRSIRCWPRRSRPTTERSFAEFTLDERAKFSDGEPVTPEDVIFTLELLRDKGLPRYGVTASKIASMEKVGEHGVRFTFKEPDRELPLILGLLPILPKHAIDAADLRQVDA